ncbi:virulence RhuM family protein [Rosistilla oblonga]|uniref:virulence RhuM family protein n=1 Tax=Rosistilla oblonga TaxID=2527990 RepID=UPI003A97EF93
MTNNLLAPAADDGGEFLLYRTDDGSTRIEVRMADENVWLSQKDMAELFQTTPQNITQHLSTIYEEGELTESATCKEYLQVRSEGKRQVQRSLKHYNLDAIISVGYRVRSHRGTQFRIWATQRLREYLIKGFAMDDLRLKQSGGGNYFEELLARIRDIRSSERVFWRKVLDIYSTSIDYDPSNETSLLFFKTVQNKMHWAAHGQTAAEVVHSRADASLPNMGLTTFDGGRPRKADVSIAKNYLEEEEIEALNRIVTAYLEFAELQAMNRKPMHMADWISKLDDFLRLSDREILTHAGKISHDSAKAKAEAEFAQFKEQQRNLPQPVDQHFAVSLDELKKIEGEAKQAQKKKPTKKAASKKKPSKKSPHKKKRKGE